MAAGSSAPLELLTADEAFLGCGSRGEVRLARFGSTFCAVKVVPLGGGAKLGAEAGSDDLAHPHIVRVIERRTADGSFLEVRELCEGGELFDTVAEQGGLEVEAATAWFSQALDAVTYCHATSAVNGRLRPEQVLLDRQDRVKLLGFHRRPSTADEQVPLLRPCSVLDAPELHGRSTASTEDLARADLWALGMLLASMVTGEPPFAAADQRLCARFATFVAQGLRAAAPQIADAVPAPLLPLLERLLHPEPARRPSAAEALAMLIGGAEEKEGAAASATGDAGTAATGAAGAEGASTAPSQAAAESGDAGFPPSPIAPVSPTPSTTSALSPAAAKRPFPALAAAAPDARRAEAADSSSKAQRLSGTGAPGAPGSAACALPSHTSAPMPPPPPQAPCRSACAAPAPAAPAAKEQRVATPRPSPRDGHVRCLGWENLELPFELLASTVVATLDGLGVPYTTEMWVGSIGSGFHVRPPPQEMVLPPLPRALADSPLRDMVREGDLTRSPSALAALAFAASPPAPPELHVTVQIFAAERPGEHGPERHHIDVRRQQGEHWAFQHFYTGFRSELSKRLGMKDWTQLSMHSPMQRRRQAPTYEPAAGWEAKGLLSPAPPPVPEERASPAATGYSACSPGRRDDPSPRLAGSPLAVGSPAGGGRSSNASSAGSPAMGSFRRRGSGSLKGFLPPASSPRPPQRA